MKTKTVNSFGVRLPNSTRLVKFMLVAIIAILLQSCTISTLLTKNRVKIPDTMVGVWDTPKNKNKESLRITKKDDYWAFIDIIEDEKKIHLDVTMHKFYGETFICVSEYYDGKRSGSVYKLNVTSKNILSFSELTIPNEEDKRVYEATDDNNREALFKKYIKEGKIIAKPNKNEALTRVE